MEDLFQPEAQPINVEDRCRHKHKVCHIAERPTKMPGMGEVYQCRLGLHSPMSHLYDGLWMMAGKGLVVLILAGLRRRSDSINTADLFDHLRDDQNLIAVQRGPIHANSEGPGHGPHHTSRVSEGLLIVHHSLSNAQTLGPAAMVTILMHCPHTLYLYAQASCLRASHRPLSLHQSGTLTVQDPYLRHHQDRHLRLIPMTVKLPSIFLLNL